MNSLPRIKYDNIVRLSPLLLSRTAAFSIHVPIQLHFKY